jgi:molybdopterin synthase sulfur carrier subunit
MGASGAIEILIASPLVSYTGTDKVEARGGTLEELLSDLDSRFPGIRFRMIDEQDRIRKHIRFFINGEQTWDLAHAVRPTDEVCIVQALSGG